MVQPGHSAITVRPRRRGWCPTPAGAVGLSPTASASPIAAAQVVHGASLAVARGEAVGLLGPNGAGKTTIFYMITGLVKADRHHRARRPRRHPPADVPARPARHRLPAAGSLDLPRAERRAEHPRGARSGRAGQAEIARTSSMPCSRSSTSAISARTRRSRSPAASGGAARSPGRWPAARPSCSSTSRSPASIRSPSATSRRWSAT